MHVVTALLPRLVLNLNVRPLPSFVQAARFCEVADAQRYGAAHRRVDEEVVPVAMTFHIGVRAHVKIKLVRPRFDDEVKVP